MKMEEMIGSHLMIGIPGPKVTAQDIETFRQTHAAGLIVFRPNFESAESFKSLITDLEKALGRRLLVAVDHEGGRVIHLREGITVFPDNLAVGRTNDESFATRQGDIEALELRRLGIDLNLAPTVDVLTENFSPNIGIRSYGRDPQMAARFASARIRAMQANGLSACAKHFPGQGQSPLDAHLDLPVLPTTWEEARSIHLIPFQASIQAGVDTIMSSHPIYPNLDPEKVPATFSRRIIYDLIRSELGFNGVILSDDLEMGALKGLCSIGESSCRAIEAGHDMVLICHDRQSQLEVYESLKQAYKNGRLKIKDLEASHQRIEALKNKRKTRFSQGEPKPEFEGAVLADKIARQAVTISKNTSLIPLTGSVSVIFPQISSLSSRIHIEDEMLEEAAFVKQLFGSALSEKEIVGLSPSDEEIRKAKALAERSSTSIFFCFDAHLDLQTKKMLEEVQSAASKCIVALLRDPFDEEWVSEKSCCITAFGFRKSQIEAVVRKMLANVEVIHG